MIKLFKTRQTKPLDRTKNVHSLVKIINTKHKKMKKLVETPERQNKKKKSAFESAFELLSLSNYFWEMNDFGDAVIK